MRPGQLFIAALLTVAAGAAQATSFVWTTEGLSDATESSSDGTSSSSDDDKRIIRAAREDAATFVASSGEIRGVYVEAALQLIRQRQPDLQASDMQLAEAILAD
jgi:uncharacterized protein (TIGR02448 family)